MAVCVGMAVGRAVPVRRSAAVDLMNQVLELFVKFATIGGGLWLVWGAVTFGGWFEGSQRAADAVGPVADRGRRHDYRGGADLQRRGVGLSRFEASGIPAWRISSLRCST